MLVACSSGEAGQPSTDPTVGGEPTVSVGEPSDTSANVSVPPVPNPVSNLDKYKQEPCAMLTKQQATSIGFPETEDATEKGQPGCRWRGHRDSRVTIALQSGEKWSLASYYKVHAQDSDAYAYFEPTTVAGFPSVFATDFDDRDSGSCAMTVALTNQDVLRMSNALFLGTDQRDKPCEQLREAAELAVKTISSGK